MKYQRSAYVMAILFIVSGMVLVGQAGLIQAQGGATPTVTAGSPSAPPGSKNNPAVNPCTGQPFHTVTTGAGLRDAEARIGGQNQWVIAFSLNTSHPEAQAFAQYTAANIGQPLAIVLDGEVLSAPTIQAALTEGGEIVGNFTQDTAQALALQLRTGALPVRLIYEKVETTDKGLRLTFGVEGTPSAEVMDETQKILLRRLNALGVADPVVQIVEDNRIIVELPGVADPDTAIRAIQQTALLEFVDFSRAATCTAQMPTQGQYILTDVQLKRQAEIEGVATMEATAKP